MPVADTSHTVLNITKALSEQWRLIGVFINEADRIERELPQILGFGRVLKILTRELEKAGIEPELRQQPIVYNLVEWSHPELGGYTNELSGVTMRQTIYSRLERWCLSFENPMVNPAHFTKCALWYTEKNGGDPAIGIKYLCDLFVAGYFTDRGLFVGVMENFLRFKASRGDYSALRGTTRQEIGKINNLMVEFTKSRPPVDQELLNELVDMLLGLCETYLDHAKESLSLVEWWVRNQEATGLLSYLSGLQHDDATKNFSMVTRALISRIEEMGADMRIIDGMRQWQADHLRPITWHLDDDDNFVKGYKAHYGTASWFDRFVSDRLQVPRAFAPFFKNPSGFEVSKLPDQWRLLSEEVTNPLFISLGVRPDEVRAEGFDELHVWDRIARNPSLLTSPLDADIKVRREMIANEVATLRMKIAMNDEELKESQAAMDLMRRLYPYLGQGEILVSLREMERTDYSGAARSLEKAILLEPSDAVAWLGLSFCMEKLGDLTGSMIFEAVGRTLQASQEFKRESY